MAELEAPVLVLERRLGEKRPRRPCPLMERLRILWLMEYYRVPKRRGKETFGVARPRQPPSAYSARNASIGWMLAARMAG